MASGATDWSWAAIAWLYEHDAEVVVGADDCGSEELGSGRALPPPIETGEER
jgi:hypothetical protein